MYVKIVLILLKSLLEIIDVLASDVEKNSVKDDTGDFLSEAEALSFGDMMYFRHEIKKVIENYELQNKLRYE